MTQMIPLVCLLQIRVGQQLPRYASLKLLLPLLGKNFYAQGLDGLHGWSGARLRMSEVLPSQQESGAPPAEKVLEAVVEGKKNRGWGARAP